VTALLEGVLIGVGFTIASLPHRSVRVLAALLSMLPWAERRLFGVRR